MKYHVGLFNLFCVTATRCRDNTKPCTINFDKLVPGFKHFKKNDIKYLYGIIRPTISHTERSKLNRFKMGH